MNFMISNNVNKDQNASAILNTFSNCCENIRIILVWCRDLPRIVELQFLQFVPCASFTQ